MEQFIQRELSEIIGIDEDNCVNCHACISACPVKFCNDGSGDVVKINKNMCIGCGKCLIACTHEARFSIDDFDSFMKDIDKGEKMIAIVAPSIAANFTENYLNVNGWLKKIGVDAIFDVSFGAELTIKSYLEHLQKDNPKVIISQPCPAIVSYLELYHPELLNHLAPVDSPMLHAIKMIRRYYQKYDNHKVVVISPCLAKKREFEETGLGDYNVGFTSIDNYFKENEKSLSGFPEVEYDNPSAERAVLFSSPGGLLKTAERWNPDISDLARKIEGSPSIYEYLDKLPKVIEENMAPVLIDCLNCENGCNAGPLTLNSENSIDEIEYFVKKRSTEYKEKYAHQDKGEKSIDEIIDDYWEDDLYSRNYENLWKNVELKYPNKAELEDIYVSMHKYSDKDIYNCTSCGYNFCEKMAIAIFNGLNKPENCHFYLEKENELSHVNLSKSEKRLVTILETAHDGFINVDEEGVVGQANMAFKEMVKRNDVIGRPFQEFLDAENRKILQEQLRLREENITSSYELTLTQSDGGKVVTLVSGTPLYDDDNKRIGSFAMLSDITELKKAEDELKQHRDELERKVKERTQELDEMIEELRVSNEVVNETNSELEKLSIVASEIDNATIIMDAKGNFEWVNDGFTKLFGISKQKVLGKNIISENTPEHIKTLIKEGIEKKVTINYEFETINKINRSIWIQATITPILDDKKKIKKLIAIDTDITALKEKEFEILHQKEEILSQRDKIQKQKEVADKQAKNIKDSISYASRIQNALLPSNDIISKFIDDYFIFYQPKDIVSGDFYWVNEVDNKFLIAAADCTGHGVPGAFMSMLGISFLNEIVSSNQLNGNISPNLILNELREMVKHSLKQKRSNNTAKDGMDLAMCMFDFKNMTMQYSGANNSVLILRDNELIEYKGDRMPIGIYVREKESFTNHEIELKKGDAIYMFTDGFIDQFNGITKDKFKKKRFKELVLNMQDLTMKEQKERIYSAFNVWRGGSRQIDDLLVIGIKI
jgi:PAS domain S-box-containing protein